MARLLLHPLYGNPPYYGQVRRCPEFRFDWLFKSRTPVEMGRRVDLLIRLIQNETKDREPRGNKKGAGAGPSES